jgi:hypothetical protein
MAPRIERCSCEGLLGLFIPLSKAESSGVSRGCTGAEDFASLMMVDLLMLLDPDGKSNQGWCVLSAFLLDLHQVAIAACAFLFKSNNITTTLD